MAPGMLLCRSSASRRSTNSTSAPSISTATAAGERFSTRAFASAIRCAAVFIVIMFKSSCCHQRIDDLDGIQITPLPLGVHRENVRLWGWGGPRLGGDDPKLGGRVGRFGPGFDTQLGVDGGEMMTDGLRRQVKLPGDLGVA